MLVTNTGHRPPATSHQPPAAYTDLPGPWTERRRGRAFKDRSGSRPRTETMLGPEGVFDPGSLLAMWAGGITGAAALVARWRIVGPGYLWLAVATAGLVGAGAWFFYPGPLVAAAWLAGLGAGLAARHNRTGAVLLAVSALLYLATAALASHPVAVLTGSVALGGITGEMLLGHWYLVDPRIPRRPLLRLAAVGALGVAIDALLVLMLAMPLAGSTIGIAISLGLAGVSCLLMVGVWFALKHPSYPGVMAATGLSYLAVLTSLGAVSTLRVLAVGTPSLR